MKAQMPKGEKYSKVKNLIHEHNLHTICTSGNCPNKGECWNAGTATFMILGDRCTRNCRFCQVDLKLPATVDWNEPRRLAQTIQTLELNHAVITSVTRDDIKDGGASFWAKTIREIRARNPKTTLEVLIPDFEAQYDLLDQIIAEQPEVISHNIETVKRLTPVIRDKFTYSTSLKALRYIAGNHRVAKSGLMLGLGETQEEVLATMRDIRDTGVKVITIGQYLQPTGQHAKVKEYVKPEVFDFYRDEGMKMGFSHVESGPLVRSSYHAERHVNA
jgi:lipoic acid synthetase